ncbi:hypothetical protein [Amycolatopsis palatopharyngis]|uniref:hypothetical protein n=1 Tax=Amycolatopsis palatopharyngis TaxID=187982 RepID=UPI000E276B13|nr:hypothetical protein [Amycolatopsis palatopharyngis]
MPSSEALRRPPEWPASGSRYRLAFGFSVALLVIAPLGIGLYYLSIGSSAGGRYALAFAALGALVAWLGYETRLRQRKPVEAVTNVRTEDGRGALRIPYSSQIYYGYGLLMGGIALVFVMAAVESVSDSVFGGAFFVFGLLALFFASMPLLMTTGRFDRGYLRLSPEGIYQRGWTFESFLPWDRVIGVFPRYSDGPQIVVVAEDDTPWQRRQITRLWRQDRLPKVQRQDRQGPVPLIDIPGKFLAVDPTLVYHLVGFYLANERARAELGTEQAVHRAQTQAFG